MSKQNPETLVDWYEQWLNQIKKEGHFAERIVELIFLSSLAPGTDRNSYIAKIAREFYNFLRGDNN